MSETTAVTIEYFTDVLCIWAYGGQIRMDELKRNFGERVRVTCRYIPLFGDTASRIGEGWRDRGGFEGYGRHVREIAAHWDHVEVHPEVWRRSAPASSVPAHVFIKAVQGLEASGELTGIDPGAFEPRSISEEAAWRLRERFFRYAEDIATRPVQDEVARGLGLPVERVREAVESGRAHGAAHLDALAKDEHQVPGSPCLVLNEGRQRLYGNIGYRVIEANVLELLHNPHSGEATWC